MQNLEVIETSVVVMQPIERGSDKELIYTTYESIDNETLFTDLTGASIQFELKKVKEGVALFRKRNTAAGGSNSQIEITTSSVFKLYLTPNDTEKLREHTYWGWLKIFTASSKTYIVWIRYPFI